MDKVMFAAVLSAAMIPAVAFSATDGWSLPPRRISGQPDSGRAWFAPVEGGPSSFDVSRIGGAEGDVEFSGDEIVVRKTNGVGKIVVMPQEAVVMPASAADRRLRVSAEVESEASEPGESKAYVRIGHPDASGEIAYSHKADGWALSGKAKLDRVIDTPPDRPQLKAAHFIAEPGDTNAIRVAIVAEGAPSVSIWRNLRVDSVRNVVAANAKYGKRRHGRDFSDDMAPPGVLEEKLAADSIDHTAQIVKRDGFARLEIDGRPVPPVIFRGGRATAAAHSFGGRRMHEAGVPLLAACIRFGSTLTETNSWTLEGFDVGKAADEIRRSMRVAPDALYVVTLRLDAPAGWCSTRSNDMWRAENGEVVYGDECHVVGTWSKSRAKAWPWPSYHSQAWRDATKDVLTKFVSELRRTGLLKRIVGFHLGGFHDAQFATPRPDMSEAAKRAFKSSGEKDYVKFLKRSPMEVQECFARHLRSECGKPIIVMRWCMAALGHGFHASHDIREFADSREIDVIVPQVEYARRSPGYAVGVKLPFSSLHFNGKLLLHEHDLRTYASWPDSDNVVLDAGLSRATDIYEWRTINRKTAGQMIARRTGFWYLDMEHGWFDDPEIAGDIAEVVRVAKDQYGRKPDGWRPTAAFVIDEGDLIGLQRVVGECERAKADINRYIVNIAASGVPFDVHMRGDVVRHPEIAAQYRYTIDYNRNTPLLSPEQINAAAKASGAYVPLPPNRVQIDMNGDFASLHCLKPGRYDFVLPRKCRVVNLKSGVEERVHDGVMPIEMTAGQTSWFRFE